MYGDLRSASDFPPKACFLNPNYRRKYVVAQIPRDAGWAMSYADQKNPCPPTGNSNSGFAPHTTNRTTRQIFFDTNNYCNYD